MRRARLRRLMLGGGGVLGAVLILFGPGPWAWVGLLVLLTVTVLGVVDGYTGWSDR